MSWIVPYIPLIAAGIGAAGAAKTASSQDENADQDRGLQAAALKQSADVAGAKFRRENPGVQMTNSVRGDVLANAQPASFTGSGRDLQVSGGLSPTLLSQNSRDLGQLTSRQALLSAMGTPENSATDPYAPPFPVTSALGPGQPAGPHVNTPEIDPVTGKPKVPTPPSQIYVPPVARR